jgi:ABC-type nitrate/sulfonate/bicarbonate transport system substrate-binding protein
MARLAWLTVIAGLLLVLACTPAAASGSAPRALTFMAGYKAQANLPFAAVYIAQEKGYFRAEGLAVTIQHSAGSGEHFRLLAGNQVQVTTATAEDVLKQRAEVQAPFVAIALFGQSGDQGFATLAKSGLKSPKDWEGKVVGYKVYPSPDYLAILKAAKVDRSKVMETSVGFDPRILTEGRVDVYPVFVSNEPDTLRRQGVEVNVVRAADYGVPTLGLTYIVTEERLRADPDLLQRFVTATLRATYDALAKPDEAVEIVMKYAPQEDRAHQRYMLDTELAAAQSDLTRRQGLGWTTTEQWQALADRLNEFSAVKGKAEAKGAFTTDLVQRAYGSGKLPKP